MIDDGSLAFLNIPRDKNSRSFNCDVVKQSSLVNKTFFVCDFIEDVPTRFSRSKGSAGQTLVLVKDSPSQLESESRKFFTGSTDILYVLRAIRERDAFPRRVTMRCQGNRFFLE